MLVECTYSKRALFLGEAAVSTVWRLLSGDHGLTPSLLIYLEANSRAALDAKQD